MSQSVHAFLISVHRVSPQKCFSLHRESLRESLLILLAVAGAIPIQLLSHLDLQQVRPEVQDFLFFLATRIYMRFEILYLFIPPRICCCSSSFQKSFWIKRADNY